MNEDGYHERLRAFLGDYDSGSLDLGQVLSEARILVSEFHPEEEPRCRAWVEALEAVEFRFDAKAERDGRTKRIFGRGKLHREKKPIVLALLDARSDLREFERQRRQAARRDQIG